MDESKWHQRGFKEEPGQEDSWGTCRAGTLDISSQCSSDQTLTLRHRFLRQNTVNSFSHSCNAFNWQGMKTHIIVVLLSLVNYLATNDKRFQDTQYLLMRQMWVDIFNLVQTF